MKDFLKPKSCVRSVLNGMLMQDEDKLLYDKFENVTEHSVTDDIQKDLMFAWKVCKHVKSNAIVLAKNQKTIGIGAGQMSRIYSTKIAIDKANANDINNSVIASDGFFPFADSINFIAEHGVKAVVQPGGSLRDKDVIDSANMLGIAMFITGTRHFSH